MPAITPDSLMSLETYARARNEFRGKVMAHKKLRNVAVGEHVTLLFEDQLTIRYQVQEMLRIERIFEQDEITSELDAYNPLIPDGSNFKATMLIEYPEPEERKIWLARLKGIEGRVWVEVTGEPRVFAIADEDIERENEEKTSSVHFLRFELTAAMKVALRGGAALSVGVDHSQYQAVAELGAGARDSLIADLT
jgi:hypothetical protein